MPFKWKRSYTFACRDKTGVHMSMENRLSRATLALAAGLSIWALALGAAQAQTFEVKQNMPVESSFVRYLPADIKSRGTINAATTDANAPWSFVDQKSGAPQGVDVDLVNDAAKRLGLTVNWSVIQFTAGIPGVQSGRYDLYVSAMADTKKREDVVNFIAYSQEGSGVIVPKGNPKNIKTMNDLCGKHVAIVTGSLFPAIIDDLNKKCSAPVTVSETADQAAPYLAVASGQADATMNTYGVSNYALKTATEGIQTQLELSPVTRFAPANQGIAFSKTSTDLMAALAGSMQAMKEDGSYQKIMDKWNVGDGAMDQFLLNAPLF
ncbi:ABC transporter substrate-binding protein [Rhizobium sp. SYY.PMSO]|uniref:ABC transporter substrate-binding protein n=1 Tax=Rhizobium sp. SYY.PMSO TaxID=3382192 RepID=UPI00398FD559